uniref:Pectinase n=1 Tax=Halalkalibacterium halodurans TaxID=86665 RepID=N0D7H9_ALKHA|nr:pectinase [Halalkalibacterium halodurans]
MMRSSIVKLHAFSEVVIQLWLYGVSSVTADLSTPNLGLQGFATLDGGTTTVGGLGGEIVFVRNELINALKSKNPNRPLTIYVNGTITPSNTSNSKISDKDVSNVSILGVGTNGRLNGIGIKVIIRNIHFEGFYMEDDPRGKKYDFDYINVENSHHIWIDHCTFVNGNDGAVDIKKYSNYITVAYNITFSHDKVSLGGSSDKEGNSEAGHYDRNITFHHNYFKTLNSRVPARFFGKAHLCSNYFENMRTGVSGNVFRAEMLVEHNVFENATNPLGFPIYGVAGAMGAKVHVEGFYYCKEPEVRPVEEGKPALDPREYYDYTLDPVQDVPKIVVDGAGAGKLVFGLITIA